MASTFIAGSGYHHPEGRLTNAHLERMVDTSDDWIMSHTGIKERRRADDAVNTSDLGVIATRRALEGAGWQRDDVELLICTTSTPDCLAPATASYICNKLELPAIAFDVNASCSGFVYALEVADTMIKSERYSRVALCAADKYTRVVDYSDRRYSIFWGDGAGTVLLQRDRPPAGAELVDHLLLSRNKDAALATTPIHGYFAMDGAAIKPIAMELMVRSTEEMLNRHGLQVSDLRGFMGHQMNGRLLDALGERLGLSTEQHWRNVEYAGNQGGAGIATTLCAGMANNGMRDGDLLLLAVVGTGFTAGSALLRWMCDGG
jgi:3-oxoacyl-[acyl-carrier-protein] synthase-3